MTNLIKNFRDLSIILILSSCSYFQSHYGNDKPQIRIVDLNGKPHNVKTRVPQLNAEAIAKINENSTSSNALQNKISNKAPIASNNSVTLNTGAYNNQQSDFAGQQNNYDKFDASGYEAKNDIKQNSVPIYNTTNYQTEVAQTTTKKEIGNNDEKQFNFNSSQNQPANNSLLIDSNTGGTKSFKFSGSKVSANLEVPPKVTKSNKAVHGIFIQTGVFSSTAHADRNLHQVSTIGKKAEIEEMVSDGKKLYKVLVGPFASKKQAQIVVRKLSKSGQKGFIIKK